MKQFTLKVKSVENATHDVLRIRIEKPQGFEFEPGQATEIAIKKKDWEFELRPFTFTCLPSDDYLEFTIKTYPEHKGVTNELLNLKAGDELIVGEPWGTINYKGPGVFIAGGAGVTPFIAIFRHLHSKNEIGNNKLIFANKTSADIINKDEFSKILGDNFVNILSHEEKTGYAHGYIDLNLLKQHTEQGLYYYVCGPDPMMDIMVDYLHQLGVNDKYIVKEEF
ncbi:MAG: FAD-binding oxidoreductase [Lentimicrobiaceae bacterium]|nr:FAD-binding oxidoreductase [Lentimicrobiaceae bacterium]